MPIAPQRPGIACVVRSSSSNSSSTRPRQTSGPASISDGSSWCPRIRPSRSVIATSMLVAPRSATSTWPADGPEGELARRAAPGARPDLALDDQPALEQLADALGHDPATQTGARDQLRARAGAAQADLVEDRDERVERLVGQGQATAWRVLGHGHRWYALRPSSGDFCT